MMQVVRMIIIMLSATLLMMKGVLSESESPMVEIEMDQIGNDILEDYAFELAGYSVALSADGSIVDVGMPFSSANGADSGNVCIFQRMKEEKEGDWV